MTLKKTPFPFHCTGKDYPGGELKRISGIFSKRIEDHRKELLSPVTGKNGKTINVVRHNGIEEIGHTYTAYTI